MKMSLGNLLLPFRKNHQPETSFCSDDMAGKKWCMNMKNIQWARGLLICSGYIDLHKENTAWKLRNYLDYRDDNSTLMKESRRLWARMARKVTSESPLTRRRRRQLAIESASMHHGYCPAKSHVFSGMHWLR